MTSVDRSNCADRRAGSAQNSGLAGTPGFRHTGSNCANKQRHQGAATEIAKLGKKGQVTIPRQVLKHLGLDGEVPLTVETTPDGAIVLRQAVLVPVEVYSDLRIKEFEVNIRIDPKLLAAALRLARAAKRR